MCIYLGIVRRLEQVAMTPIQKPRKRGEQQNQEENRKGTPPPSRIRGRVAIRNRGRCLRRLCLRFQGRLFLFCRHGFSFLKRSGKLVSACPVARARVTFARLNENKLET